MSEIIAKIASIALLIMAVGLLVFIVVVGAIVGKRMTQWWESAYHSDGVVSGETSEIIGFATMLMVIGIEIGIVTIGAIAYL